jgi:hypothetical protein
MPLTKLLSAQDIKHIDLALKDAFACACEEKSIKWLERAYQLNDGDPNLNELFAKLCPINTNGNIFYTKIINSVIAQALLHDPYYTREMYLETLWHQLKDAQPKRLESFRRQLKSYCPSTLALSHETTNPEHLGLLYLITQGNISSDKHYLTELIEVMLQQKNSPAVLSIIATMGRLHPYSLEMLSSAYTNQIMYKASRMYTEDPDRMALLRVIYPNDDEMLNCATRQLKYKISNLREEFINLEKGESLSFSREYLNDLITLISLSLNDGNKEKLSNELREAFEDLFLSNWRYERVQATLHQVTPMLNTVLEQLDTLGVDWQSIITHAFNINEQGQHNGKTDYLDSAADALLDCAEAPFKRYMAESAIKPLSTEQVLHHFRHRPDVLAEIYKITENHELIVHMNNQARHASISHDLGL